MSARILKQESYFPIIITIHLLFWVFDLAFYNGSFRENGTATFFFGELNGTWYNPSRILGEVFSSWVATVFAFNFLMASRIRWVESIFGGLDKMYVVHRRSAYIALILLFGHFLLIPTTPEFSLAKPLGFAALILILVGVILSALPFFKRKLAYHKWLNVHKLMGFFYLLAIGHAYVAESLIKELPTVRAYVFSMMFIGVVAWIYRTFFYSLLHKEREYTIQSVTQISDKFVEVILNPGTDRMEYKAGQFAFFRFHGVSKEAHPFTISSHPSSHSLRLVIKGLGDYTDTMGELLKPDQSVSVEGPFGHFTTDKMLQQPQVWIAGGIGITPFLSLVREQLEHKVKLIWSVRTKEEVAHLVGELEDIAAHNPQFEFELWNSDTKGCISVEDLGVEEFRDYTYLFCGPKGLKKAFFKNLIVEEGVDAHTVYDEEFTFR